MSPYVDGDPSVIDERVVATERANLAIYGYGAKAFTLSLIESAIELTGGRVTSGEISAILDLGKGLLDHPVELLDGVEEVVAHLADDGYRLIVVTKGDLFHQEAKVAGSGLADRFARVEIVSEKDVSTYRRVMGEAGVAPENYLMIGNSVRSDILPVIELGGHAAPALRVHVGARACGRLDAERMGFHELASIRQVPELLERLSLRVGPALRTPTRTFRNRDGAAWWPVWPTCIGWPLPQ